MLFWNHHMIFESSHKHATVAKTCLCQPGVRPALLAPHSSKFSLLISCLGFSEEPEVFQCSNTIDLQLRLVWKSCCSLLLSSVDEQRIKTWGSTFISVFLPFLLVPVILGSNSKPADNKGNTFTRVALRPPPAQGEMPILSHRTSKRQ